MTRDDGDNGCGGPRGQGLNQDGRRSERDLLSPSEPCPTHDVPVIEEEEGRWAAPERLNLVFEGGGLKGIALVGALAALSDALTSHEKYKRTYISHVAGTSAGAIVAALLGAGYTAAEITDIMNGPEIAKFGEPSWLSQIPLVGPQLDLAVNVPKGIFGLLTRLGFLKGDYLLGYLRDLLHAKRIRTFGDMIVRGCENAPTSLKYRVHMVASDITRGRMLVLPDDVTPTHYGVSPDELEVALAVRMSISFPFVFQPVRLTGSNRLTSYIVDGGLLSNFPLDLFDPGALPPQKQKPESTEPFGSLTLGIKLMRERYNAIQFPFLAARALVAIGATALEAHDVSTIAKNVDVKKWARVIEINTDAAPVFKLGPNPLDLTPTEKELLYNAGYRVTHRHIEGNFLERAMHAQQAATRTEHELVPLGRPFAPASTHP